MLGKMSILFNQIIFLVYKTNLYEKKLILTNQCYWQNFSKFLIWRKLDNQFIYKSMSVAKTQKAPLEGLNPKQHLINVVMTDGTKFQVLTSWGNEESTLTLDVDPKNHPAWQDNKNQGFINANNERVNKFKSKFDFDFGTDSNKS